jgi:hypothetical protein
MKIVITGTRSLSRALCDYFDTVHEVTCLDKSYDVHKVSQWANKFSHYDCIINCAYSEFGQLSVLEQFSAQWAEMPNKKIINIGSIVTDYCRSEREKDTEYFPYRIHKQALQSAFTKISRSAKCSVQLLNPGPFNSTMSAAVVSSKLDMLDICKSIDILLANNTIKRIDQWL